MVYVLMAYTFRNPFSPPLITKPSLFNMATITIISFFHLALYRLYIFFFFLVIRVATWKTSPSNVAPQLLKAH